MISILHSPPELSTSKNPIAYKIGTDNEEVRFILLKLWVEKELYGNVYEQIAIKESPPLNGETAIYIDRLIDACLEYDLPNFAGNAVVICKQLCKSFYVELAECLADETPDDVVWTAQPVRFAIKSKFGFLDFANKGTQKLPNNTTILRNLPNESRFSFAQKDYVTVLPFENRNSFDYEVFLTYSDGTSEILTKTLGAVQAYQPIIVPINFSFLALPTNLRKVGFKFLQSYFDYELVDTSAMHSVTLLLYVNALGGWESCMGLGTFEDETETESYESEHYIDYDYATSDQVYQTHHQNGRVRGTWRSGYLPNDEYEKRTAILQSPKLYLLRGSQFYSIAQADKKMKRTDTDRFAEGIELSFIENYPL